MAALADFTYYRGRVAQAAILRGLGISAGDHVAIQAFTCSAVAEGVLSLGAQPIYVDISPDSCTMDPADLAAKLTPKTRAVIVQHTFGIPADFPAIEAVATARGLPLVEDCAHAIGSTIAGRPVGEWGVAAFYSFEASKPVFAGIGGSARVNDPALAARMASQSSDFSEPSLVRQAQILTMYLGFRLAYRPATYWTVRSLYRRAIRWGLIPSAYHTVTVEQSRPVTEFRFGLGRVQQRIVRRELATLPDRIAHRNRIASAYRRRIGGADARPVLVPPDAEPVYGRFPLFTPRKTELLRLAPEHRVELSDWYATPVHPLTGHALAAAGYRPGSCPRAEQLTSEIVSLPTGPLVDDAQVDRAVRLFESL